MTSIIAERRGVNHKEVFATSLDHIREMASQRLGQEIEAKMEVAITGMLQRAPYGRRAEVPRSVEIEGVCQRCGSRRSQRFSRNGGRVRGILTLWGWVMIWVQRQMQGELERLFLTPLALRTLNRRLHQLADTVSKTSTLAVPPILQIDAIWVTQLVPTGTFHRDRKGRRRPDKRRIKRPIFIALGVWPGTERVEVLAWRLGKAEDEAGWVAFLEELEGLGIRGEQGLELIIHDGGAGLCAALRTVFFDAQQQRCLFHKLRNIYQAITLPEEELSPKQRRRRKKRIFKEFHAIYQAKRWDAMLRRYRQVVHRYRHTQPAAVQTLRRDFRQTITYFFIQQAHPDWPLTELRTTSRLERFNRSIRRRTRAASAYHSDTGITAMMTQVSTSFNATHP